jgi:hypothetical protein
VVGCSFCLFLAAISAAGTGSESTLRGWVNQLGKAGKIAETETWERARCRQWLTLRFANHLAGPEGAFHRTECFRRLDQERISEGVLR